jgi:quercetin 2,3-dioxygenase
VSAIRSETAPVAERRIARKVTTPAPAPGFIGDGHTAVEVVLPNALEASDPFVLLMDDRLEIHPRRRIGGAHPHAGLETVTLLLEGTVYDRDEGEVGEGDAIWMTAGRGIIHNEDVEASGHSRILQLWIRLPQRDRTMAPDFEVIRRATLPIWRGPGVEARLYSGATGDLRSPTRNRVPVTLVDVRLDPGVVFDQELPASYNGFLYVVEGRVSANVALAKGDVGWLEMLVGDSDQTTNLRLTAGETGARFVLYAGEPQYEPTVHHGPFVAGSQEEIVDYFRDFRAGKFESMSSLAKRAAARAG